MAKRVKPDAFAAEIEKVLSKYGNDVRESLSEVTTRLAKKGAKEVASKARSTFGGSGEYASGWTSRIETSRVSAQGLIYNQKPGLPHLLENGHANRGGGRTPGRPHIAPVEQELIRAFEEEVKSKL